MSAPTSGGLSSPSSSTLDGFVQQALERDPERADWSEPAKRLSPHRSATRGDAISRIFETEIGKRFHQQIGNESRTLETIGTYATHIVNELLPPASSMSVDAAITRPAVTRAGGVGPVRRADQPYVISARARRLVVYHGDDRMRRSLLILDPELAPDTPSRVLPSDEVARLVSNAKNRIGELAGVGIPEAQNPSDVLDAVWIARPRVVVAPHPKLISTCVCRPALGVEYNGEQSTVGACAVDDSGLTGVTVCYHGTGASGTAVKIDGVSRSVARHSEIVDTCFVPIPRNELPPSSNLRGRGGLLMKRAPGAKERHTFWAVTVAAERETFVTAADPPVPSLTPRRQLCIYTDAVTNYGDSGGALVNDDDQLVGLCFQRTAFGEKPEFSTWVWAPVAFLTLNLSPYEP
jgi:hypothetical protein